MMFKNVLRPIYDETYSSWITRCALSPRIHSVSENDILFWDQIDFDFENGVLKSRPLGMEFDFDGSLGIQLANTMQLDTRLVERCFKPSSSLLLDQRYRLSYCHLCIHSDVAFKRYPSWRKSWCYVTHPYCSIHRCLLSHMGTENPFQKQWAAYVRGHSGDYIEGRVRFYRGSHGISPDQIRAWLTLRVQMWIDKLNNTDRCVLPGTNIIVDSSKMRGAVELVLRLFLVPRTDRTKSGVARELFTTGNALIVHRIFNLSERLEYGAPHSVPYERMCALLLLGITFGIFSPEEHSLLNSIILKAEFWLPNLRDLGALSAEHVYGEEYVVLERLFNRSNDASVFPGDFLEGIFSSMYKPENYR
ncbi:hypothetical protein [Pseudomonas sp. O230]|uniref:hypothetical protein n=1 Tax=Pseudomonas sp. O230 TaxID=3159450 RepID=UPI00387AE2BA